VRVWGRVRLWGRVRVQDLEGKGEGH
jgi:hypothetical protein